MKGVEMTSKQISRQKVRDRTGRYAVVNPCDGCGHSSGTDYLSHGMTDKKGPDGESWGDIALVLCSRCERMTASMDLAEDFRQFQDRDGGAGRRARSRPGPRR
jgi:hypothetical protein